MIYNSISLLSKPVGDWSLHSCYSGRAQIAKHAVVLSPRLLEINSSDVLQKWIIEKELANKDESTAKNPKMK